MDDGAAVAALAGEGHHTLCLAWQRQGAQVSADLCVAGHLGVPSCVSRVQPRADCGLPGRDVGWELAFSFQSGSFTAALQVPDDTVQAADLLVGARRLVLIG